MHEEPSNYTVISGPSAYTHHQAVEEDETSDFEHLLQDGDSAAFSGSDLDGLLADGVDASEIDTLLGVDTDSNINDDGDDADIDTDDFDAESALIDEFIDDGGLTPTMTTHVSNMYGPTI